MLWLYLHFPHLVLDHIRRTREDEGALVVVEGSGQKAIQACPEADLITLFVAIHGGTCADGRRNMNICTFCKRNRHGSVGEDAEGLVIKESHEPTQFPHNEPCQNSAAPRLVKVMLFPG